MKPNPRVIAPVVLIGLVTAGFFVDRARERQRSTISGFFESQPTKLSSRIAGRVSAILVKEGDTVRKGQRLLVLETESSATDVKAKQALASQAQQAYSEAEAGSRSEDVLRQEAVVAELEASLQRLRNGSRPEEVAAARDRLRQAQAVFGKAQAGPRSQEIAQARAAERQAQARLAQAERGPTPEERAQAKARLDAANAQAKLAESDYHRAEALYQAGAVSKRAFEAARAAMDGARALVDEAQQAFNRAQLGTPAEELAQAREAHRQAKAALDMALAGTRKEDIEAARAARDAARQELALLVKGARSEDLAAAQARLAQGRAALELLKNGTRKERIAQAKSASEAASLQALSAKDVLNERVVVAPADGVVERLIVAKGDLIGAGSPVIQLTDLSDIWLRVYLPEIEMGKVKVGDEADLLVDGVEGHVAAYVESVATRGEFTPANLQTPDERGKQVFGIRLRLRSPDSKVKAGMYATVKRMGQWR
jgi:HlyD family secretion protein